MRAGSSGEGVRELIIRADHALKAKDLITDTKRFGLRHLNVIILFTVSECYQKGAIVQANNYFQYFFLF